MNQLCKVCGEPAAGFHFGAFTCEGCKSFFGRSYNNLSSITDCKNNAKCVIDKKNRTTCKACRLRKCYMVGMSKSGSRYGRRSNWFKIHCLLNEKQHVQQQEQQQQQQQQQQNKQKQGQSPVDNNVVMGITYPGINPYATSFGTPPQQGHAYNPAELMAAAIPFFRLMHSTEKLGHMHFPMPPSQLLLCPETVVAYHHRRSVDSTVSSESPQRYSSYLSPSINCLSTTPSTTTTTPSETVRQTPELCVYSSADEDEEEQLSVASSSPILHSNAENSITVTKRASQMSSIPASPLPQQLCSLPSTLTYTSQSPTTVISPKAKTNKNLVSNLEPRLAFSQKMQSLSPVSVCSISAEYQSHTSSSPVFGSTSCVARNQQIFDYQDAPLDLSTNKTNQLNQSRSESPRIEIIEEEKEFPKSTTEDIVKNKQEQQIELSNKILFPYEEKFSLRLNIPDELEIDDEQESIFPQIGDNKHNFACFTSLNNTSLRGIFVCV